LDRVVHEPARLMILAHLYVAQKADFLYLLRQTGLTQGNLSSHIAKLEGAGYIFVEKTFEGKMPKTMLRLTQQGRKAFQSYRQTVLDALVRLP
jgi:DNA-binding MarR family transcriptional regulator